MRAENLQNKEHSALKRIGELEAELSLIKQRGIPGQSELAVQPYGDKYQKLYREECRARERSDNSARRTSSEYKGENIVIPQLRYFIAVIIYSFGAFANERQFFC